MKENYMVVQLPKQDSELNNFLEEPILFKTYDEAFECINKMLAARKQQLFDKSTFNKPIRIALHDMDIELWIIKRSENVIIT